MVLLTCPLSVQKRADGYRPPGTFLGWEENSSLRSCPVTDSSLLQEWCGRGRWDAVPAPGDPGVVTLSTWPPTPPSCPQLGVTRGQARPGSPSILLLPRIVWGLTSGVRVAVPPPPRVSGPPGTGRSRGELAAVGAERRGLSPAEDLGRGSDGPICDGHGAFLPEAELEPGSARLCWATTAEAGPGVHALAEVCAVVPRRLSAGPARPAPAGVLTWRPLPPPGVCVSQSRQTLCNPFAPQGAHRAPLPMGFPRQEYRRGSSRPRD